MRIKTAHIAGMLALGLWFFGSCSPFCAVSLADDLNIKNTDTTLTERTFSLNSFDTVYNVTANTGITAPSVMSVTGVTNNSNTLKSVINYLTDGVHYSGFTVNSDITLNIANAIIENAQSSSNGSVLNNSGTAVFANVDLIANGVNTSSESAFGGAVYNTGSFTFSGNIKDNYAISENASASGGAIYSTSDVTLNANGQDYVISGNYTQGASGEKVNQAIYIDNLSSKLTISATNGGSWTIDDSISGKSNTTGSVTESYSVDLKGDRNSSIQLNSTIDNALVNIDNINLYLSQKDGNDTFKTYRVTIHNSLLSYADGQIGAASFSTLTTDDENTAEFALDVSGTDAYDTIVAGTTSSGNINISSINFINGSVIEGVYNFLKTNSTNLKLYVADTGRYSDVKADMNWNTAVNAYTYSMALSDDKKSVTVSNAQKLDNIDALSELNQYGTTYTRYFRFDGANNNYKAIGNTGSTANVSTLNILGKTVGTNYSTIDYQNNYSGFVLNSGADVNVENVSFVNANSQDDGAVFNIANSNASLNLSGGNFQNNTSQNFGGAVYVTGNSFLNSENIDYSNNSAKSGGAIGIVSEGTNYPNVNNITGTFSANSAAEKGGAIYIEGYNSGLSVPIISNITADFNANSVSGTGDVLGGAIYNFGTIQKLNGTFTSNSAVSTDGNAYGGALANISADTSRSSVITDFTASFKDNYAKSDTGNALGGAIYTSGNLTFSSSDANNPITFSGNYTETSSSREQNAIFVDTATGTKNIVFNLTNGGDLVFSDGIDGGQMTENGILRGAGKK